MGIIILIGAFILIFIGSGSVLVFIGLRKILKTKAKEKTWISAKGKVSEVRERKRWDGKKLYTPIVVFYDLQGRQTYFNSREVQLPFYTKGQDITIIYDPQNHSNAAVKGAIENKFWIFYFLVLGGGMIFLGFGMMILEVITIVSIFQDKL